MIKSLTVNGTQKRPVSKKNNGIVSKGSHKVWCIIKVQSVIRRWLAIRLLKKLKQEKLLKQQKLQELQNSLIVPLSPLSSVSSPEIITISFHNQNIDKVINKDEEKDTEKEILKSKEIKIETLDINNEVRDNVKEQLIKVQQQITIENGSNTTPFSSRSSSISSAISMSSSLSSSSLGSSESNQSNNQHQAPLPTIVPTHSSSTTPLASSTNSNSSTTASISLRKRTIDELLHVERSYVNDMNTFIDIFYTPFKTEESFPKEYLYTLFCNIEEILTVHTSFLASLEKRVSQWNETTVTVGDLFLPFMGSFQKLYEVYINNYENAFAFSRYLKTSPLYSEVNKSILNKEKDNRCRSLDFGSFLVMPIQRMPRYIVLLKEIEKNTHLAAHPDIQQCSLTLVQMQDLTLFLNESKRGSYSNEDKVTEIKQSIDGLDPSLISQNSKFIMEGPISLLKGVVASSKKELYVYLFKEFILCTENQTISTNKKISSLKYTKPTNSLVESTNSTSGNPNRTSSLINLSGSQHSNASSTNTSPSTSGVSSPSLNGAGYSTIRNRSLFKKIQVSDIKALSILKNFKDAIQIVTSKKVYTFITNSTDLRDKWYNSMNDILNCRTPPPSPTLRRNASKLSHLNSGDLSNSLPSSTTTSNTSSNRHSIQLQSSPNFQSPTIKKKNRFSIQLT